MIFQEQKIAVGQSFDFSVLLKRTPALSNRRKLQRQCVLLLAIMPLLGRTADVRANNDTYTGPTGNWSDGTKWSLNAPPMPGDSALLSPTSGSVSVNLDISATNLSQLTLSAAAGSFVTLLQSANLLAVNAGVVKVGDSGTGTYALSNGTLALATSDEYVGGVAKGTFNQSGGTHTISAGTLTIGGAANGTYLMSGGALSLTNNTIEFIGDSNAGTFTQTGGIHTNVGGSLLVGFFPGSIGTYSMTNGTLALTNSGTNNVSEYIGFGGAGTFNQTGGVHQFNATGTNGLYLGFSAGAVGTYNLNAGTASASNLYVGGAGGTNAGGLGILNINGGSFAITNNLRSYNTVSGTNHSSITQNGGLLTATNTVILNAPFTQFGGTASLGTVSGAGTVTIGGGTSAAQTTVRNFTLSTVAINTAGTLTVTPSPTRYTNTVNTLTIGANGLLDLQNHHLLVDNTATPFVKVKQYVDAVYNRNITTGIGDYTGRGGITSSVVIANADFMGVGYYNGALQNPANPDNVGQILGPNSNSGHGTGIPQSQILIRPTLTGDLNGDGVVNAYDVTLFNSFGLFNQSTNLGYQAGDLNGDGIVNAKDVTIFNSAGNFNNGSFLVAKAASAFAGHSAFPAVTVFNPTPSSLMFSYDPATGDVRVNYNGFTGFAGKPTFNSSNRLLSLIDILSTNPAVFPLDPTKLSKAATDALSSPTFTGNTEINLTAINGYLPDGTDIGRILPPGLNPGQFEGSLTFTFNYTGSRQIEGGLVLFPEPATLSLTSFGAMGLLARRRRRILRNGALV